MSLSAEVYQRERLLRLSVTDSMVSKDGLQAKLIGSQHSK